jgi:hypothetical protein
MTPIFWVLVENVINESSADDGFIAPGVEITGKVGKRGHF